MDPEVVRQAVLKVVGEIQTRSGRPLPPLNDQTRPMDDLVGFDSHSAVEASIQLSTELGRFIKPDVALFRHGRLARTVAEITEEIYVIAGEDLPEGHK